MVFAVARAAASDEFAGPAGAGGRGAARRRRAGAAGLGDRRAAGRAGARPDRRRDARQPAGVAGAAARALAGRAGRRVRVAGRAAAVAAGSRRASCARLEALPERHPAALLVAAAEPLGDPALLWRAAERLGIARRRGRRRRRRPGCSRSARGCAFAIRWCARRSTGRRRREERRRCTGRWRRRPTATSIPTAAPGTAPQAAAGPDEDVAAELERAAGRAQARGGLAAAAAFLERAAALTSTRRAARERALAAAQAKYEAGALDEALALLATAEARAARRAPARPLDLLRAQIAFAARRGSDAPPLLLEAARGSSRSTPTLARETYLEALSAAIFAGRLAARRPAGGQRGRARRPAAPRRRGRPTSSSTAWRAGSPTATRRGAPICKRALSALSQRDRPPARRRVGSWLAGRVASDLWDDETLEAARHAARSSSPAKPARSTALPLALSHARRMHALAGELAAAASLIDESCDAITEATGSPAAATARCCSRRCAAARPRAWS